MLALLRGKRLAVVATLAVVLVVVFVVSLSRGGDASPEPLAEDAAGLRERLGELVDPQRLIGQPAYWAGYPLPRPEWCPSTRGAWTMGEVEPGRVIPACTEMETATPAAWLGLWEIEGCHLGANGPQEASTWVRGVVEQVHRPLVDYSYWTECPPAP